MTQVHLDIWKKLNKRHRKRVEIQKSMHSLIQYQADLRRSIEVAQMRSAQGGGASSAQGRAHG